MRDDALAAMRQYGGPRVSLSDLVLEMDRLIREQGAILKDLPKGPVFHSVEQLGQLLRTVMITEGVMLKKEQVESLVEKLEKRLK